MDLPPHPEFMAATALAISLLLPIIFEEEGLQVVPPCPAEYHSTALTLLLRIFAFTDIRIDSVIRTLFPGIRGRRTEIWPQLAAVPAQFWRLTGETPNSLRLVVNRISADVERFIRNPRSPRQRIRETRPCILSVRDRVLMLFIWLRSYPTFSELGSWFGVSEATAAESIHTILLIAISHYERRYTVWHPLGVWNDMRGSITDFSDVVAMIDATPIRINRPQGELQRMYYRRDRGFHFINWQVIADCDGFFTYGQAGFLGHLTDAGSFGLMPRIGHNCALMIPRNTFLLADSGYPRGYPLLVPFSRRGGRQLTVPMMMYNGLLSRYRVLIEHRIHDLKVYRCVSGRFRHRRWRVSGVANLVMALTNRRRRTIVNIRESI